ncbi:MAG: DEAD/DEAH box helicase [Simkania sp.]|nr:DEAD/DEAH box helicase [Simkania sp.]
MTFPFKNEHEQEGDLLIQSGDVKSIVFSEGTYQVEVFDQKLGETFWPFLQIDDEGALKDSFCTCETAEAEKSCAHLAAAFLQVSGVEPLHIQFHSSFWNHLCFMAFTRHGADTGVLEKKGEKEFICPSPKGEMLFSVKIKTQKGQELLDEYVFNRVAETEETSLKFSNLSSEELALWKRGTPTQKLQYELSFWSDLAKWMMTKQLFREKYSIDFQNADAVLPKKVVCHFPDLDLEFYIAEVNWETLIPSLKDVDSPLRVHEFQDIHLQKMTYHPETKEIRIHAEPIAEEKIKERTRIKIGEWEFQKGEGFFPINMNPLLKKKVISQKQIGEFLSHNIKILEKYLVGTKISREKIKPSYELKFDAQKKLHISCYAFQAGDLQTAEVTFFKPWVYLKEEGFHPLDEMLFDGFEKVIPPEGIGDFINEHKLWLNQHEGFQIHLSNVEFHLIYRFEDLKRLSFENESKAFEGSDEILDFGDWLYIKGKGFYKKLRARGLLKITPETEVLHSEIPQFIHENREELEQIKSFFNPRQPVESAGLNISLDSTGKIHIEPEFLFLADYVGKEVHFLGDFTYVEGEGFAEIPQAARLPEKYRNPRTILESQEPYFVTVELTKLKPFIQKIDKRLKRPHNLNLKVNYLQQDPSTPGKKWIIDLVYESEFGEESIGVIKEGLDHHRSYAITEAGLIFFKDPRFNWLRELSENQIGSNGQSVELTTLEWIRLRTYEDVTRPTGNSEKEKRTRELLEQMDSFESAELLNLDALESTLRPYQEVGVKWLWFLYSYGLSGLLCDDMGLGKTHQAMALLAAASHAKEKAKFFVVCPTSVIYHWEELLSRFLPSLKVVVFYGTQRSLKAFNIKADLLLTSYGTLRSEKDAISKIPFDVAIFDETQIAKNMQSQTHQALAAVKAGTKIGLTGTPIENRLLELKALFDVVLPGYLPSQAQYREHFINPIEKYQDKEKKQLLAKLIHPFVLRRKKSEVLDDLPEKIEEIARCELSEEQLKLYKEAYVKSRDKLLKEMKDKQSEIPYLHVFALLNTLKQICNHPSLILKDIANYKEHQSGKWDLFVELLSETRASGQKLVVFTQYLDMMKIIESHLKEHGIGFAAIRGSTQDRKKQLETFRDDPECEVFVASLKAAGTGIDLTAASVVIHYDRWWNPAKENQATDRVHRIGQNRGVQVFKMVTKRTVEEHIHRLIVKKEGLLESVVGYDDQDQIKHFNREDILELISQINKDVID